VNSQDDLRQRSTHLREHYRCGGGKQAQLTVPSTEIRGSKRKASGRAQPVKA